MNVGLNKTEKKVLMALLEDPDITADEMSQCIGVTKRTIERNLSKLQSKGIIERIGSRRDGRWSVIM